MTRVFLKPGEFSDWRRFAHVKQGSVADDCGWTQGAQSHVERGTQSVEIEKLEIMHSTVVAQLKAKGRPVPEIADLIERAA